MEPSEYDIDFIVDGVRHHYGFTCTSEKFISEWLHSFPSGRRQTLFTRDEQDFSFGRGLKGRNKIIADLTRPNSLYLSAALQNDHEDLTPICSFFSSSTVDISPDVGIESARYELVRNELDERVIEFLGKLGTGIVGHKKIKTDDDKGFRRDIAGLVKKWRPDFQDKEFVEQASVEIELAHQSSTGEPVYFKMNRESAGTRRLLAILGPIFRVIDKGALMIVDELSASLHAQACEALLAIFSIPSVNTRGAQLIATTHDTNLLRSEMLRRDQIWFTEKDQFGATHLYPLTDIRTRKGDNIERGYLQGRYGAIPFAGPVAELLGPK